MLHLLLRIYFSDIWYKPSTLFLDYITSNLDTFNDTEPTIIEIWHHHIDPIL